MTDRIMLDEMRFYGYHGVNPEERTLGQPYIVDLTAEMDLRRAGRSDRLEDTASYSQIYRAVRDIVEGQPHNLLESIAEAIAARVLADFPVDAVTVTVKKPSPPVRGSSIRQSAVQIRRCRDS